MTNIIDIMQKASSESLVLLDELGAGTDPIEGAALAISILESLRANGAKIAATTHYAELKVFALQTDGVENGSCEFDVATLRPTYRLLIGVPGRTNAFEIMLRLGLPSDVVEQARTLVSSESAKFEDVVQSLEASRQGLEREREEASLLRQQAETLRAEAEEKMRKASEASEKQLETARSQAAYLIARAKGQIDALVDELEERKKQKQVLTVEDKAKLRADMRSIEDAANPIRRKEGGEYVLPRPLAVGDTVLIFDIDKQATVLEPPDSTGNVLVQAGIIKTRVPVSNLRLTGEKVKSAPKRSVTRNVRSRAEAPVVRELDLRGQSAMEAIMELDNFIDAALLAGVNQLTVIHGKGTGVLRKAVQEHLRNHPSVRTYRLGVYGEGESGVTVVELK
jgi:DNA mismatch repair protein MutS2